MNFFLLIAFLLITSGNRSFGQLIKEKCTRNHSIITVNSTVSVDSIVAVSSDVEECYWLLKPTMTKYIANIGVTYHKDVDRELSLYEYDDKIMCPGFETACNDSYVIGDHSYINGTCVNDTCLGMSWCKVNRTESDDNAAFSMRWCNACFTGQRSVNLTKNSNTCYHTCDGKLHDKNSCKKTDKLKVPAVIKYVKRKAQNMFVWWVRYKPCPRDATTFPPNTSSQATPVIADMTPSTTLIQNATFSITETTPGINEEPAEPEFPIWKTIIILVSTLSMIGFIALIAFFAHRRKKARKNEPPTKSPQPVQIEDEPGYANVTTTFSRPGGMTSLQEPDYITAPATVPAGRPIIEKHAYEGIIVEPEVPSNPVYSSVKNQENTYLQPIRREFMDGENGYQVAIPRRVEDHQYVHFQ